MEDRTGLITGEWTDLAFLNYRTDPDVLAPYLPAGTELDLWRGEPCLSVVGIHVRRLRIGGAPAPLHREYAQVNLRFCVRRPAAGETRRGVVFLRELVPSPGLPAAARVRADEPLQPAILRRSSARDSPPLAEYVWDELIRGGRLFAEARVAAEAPREGSFEEWLLARPWGYTGRPGRRASEYRIEHPAWAASVAERAQLSGNLASTFGEDLADTLRDPPFSAVLSRGSLVTLYPPVPI